MENMPIGIIWLLAIIGVFFLCRELLCWYWKINKSIANQERIIELLDTLVKQGQVSIKSNQKTE
ncbi:hypothetical protein H8784_15860 [Parabacteroides acidifaciens]|uniref:Uncharacterized protein n=1 Tax=Parabacteroides acidifaciens TaxID=2290935 RepID=A0A3D8HB95_9BACT|nr:hypothetical protein [Parabacteroides acidifaciens]MBC8603187.1 hypothetical protein [Parabacteroides acidifaciens]RDU48121.1 hypothetical protein DWU89_16265 [Parabacteroides acidifaciens]